MKRTILKAFGLAILTSALSFGIIWSIVNVWWAPMALGVVFTVLLLGFMFLAILTDVID